MNRLVKRLMVMAMIAVAIWGFLLPTSAAKRYPDGASVYETIADTDNYNRTIYVYHRDEAGNLLKYCEYDTGTLGKHDAFSDTIYGYDITAYSSNQGIGEECYLSWASGNEEDGGYGQIGYEFYKLISQKSLTLNFTYKKQEATTFQIKHYLVDQNGNKTLYHTSTAMYSYGDSMAIHRRYPTGYTLREGYASGITGPFTYDVLNSGINVENRIYYDRVWDAHRGEMYDRKTFTWTDKDWLDYCVNREINVTFLYDINHYTISFNANGGTGAPDPISKYHGETVTIPTKVPTRSGYTFLGWGASGTSTAPSYQPGGNYSSNSGRTFYAIWGSNAPATYTVSYHANGGSGAPASQTKTKDVALTLSSTKPTRSGYTFLGWSASSSATSATYAAGGSYTANSAVTLYAVWQKKATTYTVSYHANGGSGAPSAQSKTENVALTLSATVPYRSGYTFLGWSTSRTASTPTYYAGGRYTSNASATLYAVWEQNAPETYTVRYNANGGSGAPAAQTKTEGVTLTLSQVIPARSGYDFLGWSTSSTATSATYASGGSYTANASVTLYAVWKKTNYDFSISGLTVSNSDPYKYDTITVKVRTDSWDQVNAYSRIPVQLYYDGRLLSTQYVDFTVYGIANITFTLNVGSSVGTKTIEVRINWADHTSETRTENNTVSTSITVQEYDYEVTVEPVSTAGDYCEGMEVVSSFYVINNSDYDIIPSMHNTARFTAYYYSDSRKVIITTQDWNDVVIPASGTNLVYFKWTVPAGLNGKTVYLECTINADRSMNEANYDNNTVSFSTMALTAANSQTPDTRFEHEAPSSYQNVSAPSVCTDKATWTMWVYENGGFVLKRYGVQVSMASPVVAPSSDCVTAEYESGRWTMRSGYGITMSYAPDIVTVSGYDLPDSNAYTTVQAVVATFPEFCYFGTDGNCRTLEYVGGSYQFIENPDADGNARVHFIPVYVKDGDYVASVTATQVWTPVGMIQATRNANVLTIDGTIYDDWFQG